MAVRVLRSARGDEGATAGGDSMGLITLDGVDLGALHLTNSASGVIGAGLDLTSGFDFAGWRKQVTQVRRRENALHRLGVTLQQPMID